MKENFPHFETERNERKKVNFQRLPIYQASNSKFLSRHLFPMQLEDSSIFCERLLSADSINFPHFGNSQQLLHNCSAKEFVETPIIENVCFAVRN